MEDRYLFKAKFDDSDRWVKGQLVEVNDTYLIIPNHASKILAGWFSTSNVVEVKKDTICQCTGLKDRNGKLIWENEIIKCKFGIAVAVWDKSEWRIKWVKDNIWRKDLHYWVVEDNQRTEVIGNIFDNKELLESEEK